MPAFKGYVNLLHRVLPNPNTRQHLVFQGIITPEMLRFNDDPTDTQDINCKHGSIEGNTWFAFSVKGLELRDDCHGWFILQRFIVKINQKIIVIKKKEQ